MNAHRKSNDSSGSSLMTSLRCRLGQRFVALAAMAVTSIALAQAPAAAPAATAPTTTTAAATAAAPHGACTECGVVKSITAIENWARPMGRSARARANAGNKVEAKHTVKQYWSVVVTMDDGSTRNFTYKTKPQFREGDRVSKDNPGHHVARAAD
jgi:hypothetical protein